MFFGMWLVWILGGLGVFFFGGLLGIGDWAYFFLATGLLAGASAAVNRILERLRGPGQAAPAASSPAGPADAGPFFRRAGRAGLI